MQRRPISLDPQVNTQPVEKSYYTFVAGLNTDASPLNFPDNFSSDEENFILNLDGSRQRRKGLALETGGQSITTNTTVMYNSGATLTVIDVGTGEGVTFTYNDTYYVFYKNTITG